MPDTSPVRIDKFLWSVRIFKTRSIATDACRKGRILINGLQTKPSKPVIAGEIITIKKPPVIYTYRVIRPVEKRVAAKLAPEYIEDMTPEEEKVKLKMKVSGSGGFRERGTGRPTKKERRDLDRLSEGFNEW